MSGDVHVRFSESEGVRFPLATHPLPVSVSEELHADLLWVPSSVPDPIEACTVTVEAADAWLGLLGAATVLQGPGEIDEKE